MATTILLLHGHGDGPDRLAPVRQALVAALDADVRTPPAPIPVFGGHAWWDDAAEGPDEAVIRALRSAHADAEIVVGFSQGAAMALALGLGAAVVCVAGFLPGDAPLAVGTGRDDGPDVVFVVHGEDDDVVDPMHGRLVARRCRALGAQVDEASHPGGHVWDDDVTALVVAWLRERRDGGTAAPAVR